MRHHLIWYANWILISIIAFSLIGTVWYMTAAQEIMQPAVQVRDEKPHLPVTSFTPKDKKHVPLDAASLQLEYKSPKMRLPDLRNFIFYYGHNLRPDAKDADNLFFSLGPVSETNPTFSVHSKEKLFLVIQDNSEYPYALSPGNRPTTLWFEPEFRSNGTSVQVRMKDEQGHVVQEPQDRANFTLTEKPPATGANKSFMLDQFRADATLFSRQKAKWHGSDQFLEDHGGIEFEPNFGKQRIQFGEAEDLYTVYLDKGDVMVWKEGKWMVPEPGKSTTGYPLARVSKIEERTMGVELFDVSGRNKVNLTLLKLMEPKLVMNTHDFEFIGARTRIHSMFFVGGQREIVGPDDWFLHTQDGWKKLKTAKEIDAYVSGVNPGDLLVINKIEKLNENQWLSATLYSRSRSNSEPVMLPLRAQGNDMEVEPELIKAVPHG
jgi:hypothetical protein